ncbi:unannotated protein [freshwater metagenome]|uniref:Unannotated protein n=1 Tax=freshwater metagenome TaxID=449393 RepID=A0A6J6TKW2_9ZZZZ
MIESGKSETRYEYLEIRASKPGNARTLVVAPPISPLASKIRTLLPARARYAAATKPLWPAPIMVTSQSEAFIREC